MASCEAGAQERSVGVCIATLPLRTSQTRSQAAGEKPHYFRMMKELALLGYFTSAIRYTQAMRHVESPGRYDPCATYAPGEKA